jgi:CRISPR-associated protein Csd1
VRQHYEDLVVVGDHKVPSIYRILLETAVRRDSDNVAPGLERALMQSILLGTNYPYSLYQAMLRRIRAEGGQDPKKLKGYPINAVRVGILKGYLNRKNRINNRKERMTMALNPDERDKGYLLGRLFAVLEKAQKDALGNVNASIVDKYLNSALATPQMVFPMLLTLSKKHNAKSGSFYNDRLTGEIVNQLPSSGFPISLNPEEQGRFIIGYYHQNVSLYTPKVHRAKDDVSADANENNPN